MEGSIMDLRNSHDLIFEHSSSFYNLTQLIL